MTDNYGFRTKLSHLGRRTKHEHGFVNPPLLRGSTVLMPTVAQRKSLQAQLGAQVLTYGTGGSETHWALENTIAAIEGGTRCYIVSTGLAAVTVPLLVFLKSGDHMLMPDHVYGPARNFASGMLVKYGVETTYYDPCITGEGLSELMRPNTTVVYTESPGSHTFEVQDIPAIAAAAHAGGAKVLMDNTWGIHHFQPFKHGVDVSIQAATKYLAGHSDVLIGSITVNNEDDWQTLHAGARQLGQYASPDDCWLTLRGIRTMGVRLAAQMDAAMRWRTGCGTGRRSRRCCIRGYRVRRGTRYGAAILPGRAACSEWSSNRRFRPRRRMHSWRRWSCSASVRPGAVTKASRCRRRGISPARPEPGGSLGRWCGYTLGWRTWTI